MGVKSNVFSNPCCVIREISLFSSVSRDINALAQELGTAQETLGLVVTSVTPSPKPAPRALASQERQT